MSIYIIFLSVLIFVFLFIEYKENFAIDVESSMNINSVFNINKILMNKTIKSNDIIIQGDASINNIILNTTSQGKFNYIPFGTIIPFYKDLNLNNNSIPPGWVECNGSNGTPDLRSRFIYGKSSETDVSTGGEEKVTLTLSQLPSHKHYYFSVTRTDWRGDSNYQDHSSVSSISNSNVNPAGGEANNTVQPHNNMPPYYAIIYIMKI